MPPTASRFSPRPAVRALLDLQLPFLGALETHERVELPSCLVERPRAAAAWPASAGHPGRGRCAATGLRESVPLGSCRLSSSGPRPGRRNSPQAQGRNSGLTAASHDRPNDRGDPRYDEAHPHVLRNSRRLVQLHPKLTSNNASSNAAAASARARPDQLPCRHIWGRPGHRYNIHGILRISPNSLRPRNCNFQKKVNQGNKQPSR